MDDVFNHSNLADALDSESDEEYVPKGVVRAPNVNTGASKRIVLSRRVFIDSRDRDRTRYANANDFRLSMIVPLRAIRTITLTDAYIPIVSGHIYVAVVLRNLKDKTLIMTKGSAGLPGGVLAIIPLIPAVAGSTYTYYRSQTGQTHGGSSIGWCLQFPQGIPQMEDLHMQLYAWGWSGTSAESIPYPVPVDAAVPNAPLIGSNVTFTLEIGHDV